MDKEETHTPGECHSATWTEERFRPPGAEDGTLIFLCAGDEALYTECREALEVMGKKVALSSCIFSFEKPMQTPHANARARARKRKT